jgi:hypothetical protein
MADSMTQLRKAGPPGTRRNIAILGDGFTAADQATYNQWVQTTLIEGVFGHDYFSEDASAYNIYRVNLESVDSGVSTRAYDEHGTPTDASDDTIVSTTTRNTALGMIFSGSWAHCWLEYGPNTEQRIQAALNTWVPDWNELLVVLNNPNYGGCGGGGRAHVPMGVSWTVIAHEFGHGIGSFADEYSASGNYTGGEQGWINLTTVTDRATTKWHQFIAPSTPLPTGTGSAANYNNGPRPAGWDSNQDVGLFEGGGTFNTGIYRPVENCRMRGNTPPYCPVCYTSIKTARDHETAHHFRNAYAGRFYGSGRSDVLLHHGTSIQLFRADGTALTHAYSAVERVPGSWQFMSNDKVYVGDFNGDGTDEVAIFNGTDWIMPYLGLLESDGAGGLRLVARYDGDIPGWGGLARHDEFFVGDLTGDGADDLVIFNGLDWAMAYVGLFRASAGGYSMIHRYDGDIPGWGGLAQHDKLILGDFDGDGHCDVFVFNGDDWSMPYLGMFRSTGSGLAYVHRYDGDVPGWDGLGRHDRFFAADIDGTGRCDLWVWNHDDWSVEYLGRMLSSGTGLKTDYVGDWVGEWNLGAVDAFEVARMTGASGLPQLYVHNTDWFGVIDGRKGVTLDRIYYRWIHNYRYGRNW